MEFRDKLIGSWYQQSSGLAFLSMAWRQFEVGSSVFVDMVHFGVSLGRVHPFPDVVNHDSLQLVYFLSMAWRTMTWVPLKKSGATLSASLRSAVPYCTMVMIVAAIMMQKIDSTIVLKAIISIVKEQTRFHFCPALHLWSHFQVISMFNLLTRLRWGIPSWQLRRIIQRHGDTKDSITVK